MLTPAADGTPPKNRLGEIYLGVASLFEQQESLFSQRERELAADILKRLSKEVEMSIRIALAERVADDPKAPHELVLLLVDDRIEVARPILARSPVLSDQDLIRIITTGSFDHQIAIAERHSIGVSVSAALARGACEAAVLALLRNPTAAIAAPTFGLLAERSQTSASLQEALSQRPDLPATLAAKLYGWVSEGLKTALQSRYPEISNLLAEGIAQSTVVLEAGRATSSEISARKLIEKLHASGQLRPSFLIRVLNQGQMDLFEHGFASLLQMDVEALRKALYGTDPAAVALACRAAGIDRAVFLTVFHLSRHHRNMPTALSEAEQNRIQAIFAEVARGDALSRLRSGALA